MSVVTLEIGPGLKTLRRFDSISGWVASVVF